MFGCGLLLCPTGCPKFAPAKTSFSIMKLGQSRSRKIAYEAIQNSPIPATLAANNNKCGVKVAFGTVRFSVIPLRTAS